MVWCGLHHPGRHLMFEHHICSIYLSDASHLRLSLSWSVAETLVCVFATSHLVFHTGESHPGSPAESWICSPASRVLIPAKNLATHHLCSHLHALVPNKLVPPLHTLVPELISDLLHFSIPSQNLQLFISLSRSWRTAPSASNRSF